MTQNETSQLPGAGKKFTITAELMDFGDSRSWNNEIEYKLNLKNPKLRVRSRSGVRRMWPRN